MGEIKYVPSKEVEEVLNRLRLLDDDFMTKFFDQNFPAIDLLLNVILWPKKVFVKKIQVQKVEKSPLPDGRDVWLDIFAVDTDGKNYDIEIQRAEEGASHKRARFLSSVMDSRMLKKGESFSNLNESYMIFITETDVMHAGLPLYHVNRVVEELSLPFDDGNHIIYVNGAYRDSETEIGKLMHDFRCTKSEEMYFDILKDGMRHYKETEGGREIMCKALEDYGNKRHLEGKMEGRMEGKIEGKIEGRIEGKMEGRIETAKNLAGMGMDISVIAKALNTSESIAKEWIGLVTA